MAIKLKSTFVSAIFLSSISFPAFANVGAPTHHKNAPSQRADTQRVQMVSQTYRNNVSENRFQVRSNATVRQTTTKRVVKPVPVRLTFGSGYTTGNRGGQSAVENAGYTNTPVIFSTTKKIRNSTPVIVDKGALQAR